MKYLVGIGGMLAGGAIVAAGQPIIGGVLLLVTVGVMAVWPSSR